MINGIDPGEWTQLLGRANAGELSLHPEVGRELDKVCDDQIEILNSVLGATDFLYVLSGFGTFPSGIILAKKFAETVAGVDRSLATVLKQHIDAIITAKAVVAQAIANFVAQDEDRASNLSQVTTE